MERLTAVLIDDEKHCLETLAEDLGAHCPEIEVVMRFEASAPALSWLRQHQVDVVFLDIILPGMSGFQLLEQLSPLRFHVIYTTAYSEYAVQALRASAVDFLLKPIDPDELKTAVKRLLERKENHFSLEHITVLLENLNKQAVPARLALPTRNGYDFLPLGDILYFEADGNYTYVFLKDRDKLFVTRSLKELEAQVSGFNFCRIHNGYLVNLGHVDRYLRGDGGQVVMSNGEKLPVSRGKRDGFWGRLR